jgi:hypothetical protein
MSILDRWNADLVSSLVEHRKGFFQGAVKIARGIGAASRLSSIDYSEVPLHPRPIGLKWQHGINQVADCLDAVRDPKGNSGCSLEGFVHAAEIVGSHVQRDRRNMVV